MNITVTARLNTFHPLHKIGVLIQGQPYTIDEVEFAPEIFTYAGTIGIKPSPAKLNKYTTNPAYTYNPVSADDSRYCGGGSYCGMNVSSDAVEPFNLNHAGCGNKFYAGMGIFTGQGI